MIQTGKLPEEAEYRKREKKKKSLERNLCHHGLAFPWKGPWEIEPRLKSWI